MKIKKLQRLLRQSGNHRLVITDETIYVEREEHFNDHLPTADGFVSQTTDQWFFKDETQLKEFLRISGEDDE